MYLQPEGLILYFLILVSRYLFWVSSLVSLLYKTPCKVLFHLLRWKGLPFYLLHWLTTCNARQWQLAVSISLFLLLIILRDAPVLLWAGDALLHYHVSAERAGDRWSAVGEKCHEGSCCHHSPPSHPFSPLPHCLPSHNSPPLPPHPCPIPPPSPPHSPCQDC